MRGAEMTLKSCLQRSYFFRVFSYIGIGLSLYVFPIWLISSVLWGMVGFKASLIVFSPIYIPLFFFAIYRCKFLLLSIDYSGSICKVGYMHYSKIIEVEAEVSKVNLSIRGDSWARGGKHNVLEARLEDKLIFTQYSSRYWNYERIQELKYTHDIHIREELALQAQCMASE